MIGNVDSMRLTVITPFSFVLVGVLVSTALAEGLHAGLLIYTQRFKNTVGALLSNPGVESRVLYFGQTLPMDKQANSTMSGASWPW